MNSAAMFTVQRGTIDLRGFEVVRVQFFNFVFARSLTLSGKGMRFSSVCIRELGSPEYVETLMHPSKKSLVVKPCSLKNKLRMRWAVFRNGKSYSRNISGAAFIGTLYELFGLSPEYRYRFRGNIKQIDGEKSIAFDLNEPEIITAEKVLYPEQWHDSFGMDYYRHMSSLVSPKQDDSFIRQLLFNTEPDIRPTSSEILSAEISALLDTMRSSEAAHGTESGSSL